MPKLIVASALLLALAGARSAGATADPVAAQAKIEQARALLPSGRTEEVISLFREAVVIDPENAVAHNALGSLLNRIGHYDAALKHAEAAVRIDPTNARYRYNRGVVRAEHGRFAEAIADFDIALAAHPDLAYGWLERGAAKLSLGDVTGAEADWAQAAETDPKMVWPRWYQATGQFIGGDYPAAAAGFDAVATAEPGFVPAKLWRVIAHGRAGAKMDPPDAGSTEWPAAILDHMRGKIGEADLLRSADENRTSGDQRRLAEAHFFLAQRAIIDGDQTGAAGHLRKALIIPAPRHVWRIAAERDLKLLAARD